MVWTGISIYERTNLHIIRNGNLAAQSCIDVIPTLHDVFYLAIITDSFLFMHDNVQSHSARFVKNMSISEIIECME